MPTSAARVFLWREEGKEGGKERKGVGGGRKAVNNCRMEGNARKTRTRKAEKGRGRARVGIRGKKGKGERDRGRKEAGREREKGLTSSFQGQRLILAYTLAPGGRGRS